MKRQKTGRNHTQNDNKLSTIKPVFLAVLLSFYSFFNLVARLVDGWSTPRPGRFTPGNEPVPIVQGAGWVPGPVWTGAENPASTEIRSPDRPGRSESQHRLSYPGPRMVETDYYNVTCCTASIVVWLANDALERKWSW
jgi:hypothetical protein